MYYLYIICSTLYCLLLPIFAYFAGDNSSLQILYMIVNIRPRHNKVTKRKDSDQEKRFGTTDIFSMGLHHLTGPACIIYNQSRLYISRIMSVVKVRIYMAELSVWSAAVSASYPVSFRHFVFAVTMYAGLCVFSVEVWLTTNLYSLKCYLRQWKKSDIIALLAILQN